MTTFIAVLAFVSASVAAGATTQYALTTFRMHVDASSPRLAISVGNVQWPPYEESPTPGEAYLTGGRWLPYNDGDDVRVDSGCWTVIPTVARLRNDGAATAYVTVTADKSTGRGPEWQQPDDSPIFRVSYEEFTVSPGTEVDVTLWPGLSPAEWVSLGDLELTWSVAVRGQVGLTAHDATRIKWRVEGPVTPGASGAPTWSRGPARSCAVDDWTRVYPRMRDQWRRSK